MELKRDTEREDEIKSIKHAWETHEPGRAAKVVNSLTTKLLRFYFKHCVNNFLYGVWFYI